MIRHTFKSIASCVLLTLGSTTLQAQTASVNAICSTDGPWCELAAKEFTRQTGIKVFQTHKATGEAQAQLRAEAANPKTDIWWGGTGDPYYQAAEIGLLDAYRPAYINDLHGWAVRQYAMSQNYVGGFYTSAIGFGYNEEVLKKKNLPPPKCWKDLLNPIYKGEIETSHPASSGTAYTILAGLVQLMGEDAAFDYLKKLNKNVTQYTRSGQAQARSVARARSASASASSSASRTNASPTSSRCSRWRPAKARATRSVASRWSRARATRRPPGATTTGS
jgi:iron(III) transport system substrate-binding protein